MMMGAEDNHTPANNNERTVREQDAVPYLEQTPIHTAPFHVIVPTWLKRLDVHCLVVFLFPFSSSLSLFPSFIY
jgi:hypothetical protein